MVLVGFNNFPNCFLNILIFITLGDIFWFCSTTFFNNVNICSLRFFASSLSLVIFLFPSISVISFFSNPLFLGNGLMKAQKFLFVIMSLFLTLLRKDFMFFLLSETHRFVVFYKLLCFFR